MRTHHSERMKSAAKRFLVRSLRACTPVQLLAHLPFGGLLNMTSFPHLWAEFFAADAVAAALPPEIRHAATLASFEHSTGPRINSLKAHAARMGLSKQLRVCC